MAVLEEQMWESLLQYECYAWSLGVPATGALSVGTEVALKAEKIALDLKRLYPHSLFVGGRLIFDRGGLWKRILHNETAIVVQWRLQQLVIPMIVLPIQINLKKPTFLLPLGSKIPSIKGERL
ncbi:hypothetical protein [Pajaroellobacter abortibovis]|uniref:Uncharacterized protein n=1 Tax=Pajaroellobacter abortibovis TaxID=1882918 RepID=A0A1L6MYC5_9BACT|nr:hypothetical protein [Pajaroellobacter abortibovis]APS00509.1 hypothetical protein BCY86_07340 [Pajaroellobacter abortibovis]